MARTELRIRIIRPTDEDFRAADREFEEHLKKYGDNPAPHLRSKAESNFDRIVKCLVACYDFEVVS